MFDKGEISFLVGRSSYLSILYVGDDDPIVAYPVWHVNAGTPPSSRMTTKAIANEKQYRAIMSNRAAMIGPR